MAISDKFLKTLKDSPEGAEYLEYLKQSILSIDTLDGIDFTDKEKAAIEGRSREIARNKLIMILKPLVDAQDTNIIKDKRDSYAIEVEGKD